jgi:stearoyl-CoA desaturase (delta-9 desaturase)
MRILKSLPFLGMHVACVAVIFTGVHAIDIALCFFLYFIRMFGITGGYHRYFSHRSFKTSRSFQFVLACLGCSALQKGPLWWSAHHRDHHRFSDTEDDPHSPIVKSIWHSHVGWVLSSENDEANMNIVKDLRRYPELVLLDTLHWVPGILLGVLCFLINGWSGLVVGFVISTVLLYHGTFTVNSLCHLFGRRRFNTTDASRNNSFVAVITLGEGWHNNHHHYQGSARQGIYWWEIDVSYYIIKFLYVFGVVWDIRKPGHHKVQGHAAKPVPALTKA